MPEKTLIVQAFPYKGHTVRTVGTPDTPQFVAADLCRVLDLGNVTMALARLDDDEKGFSSIDTLGGPQNMAVVNECGMYSLILSSRKPEAKEVKRWVTHDVLPSIRKTGAYLVTTDTPQNKFALMRQMLDQLEEQEVRLQQIEQAVARLDARVDLFGADTGYRTIRAFAKERGVALPECAAKKLGIRAAALCRQREIRIGDVPDGKYGTVHSYPVGLIEEAFNFRG